MNGITELAKLLKERENGDGYSPIFGTVIELPNTKIRISDKVILTDSHITLCINLKEKILTVNISISARPLFCCPMQTVKNS